MMDRDDFDELNRLLEKCCDSCLLTRAHCANCRIDKIIDILSRLSKSSAYELISLEELRILTKNAVIADPVCEKESAVIAKWRHFAEGPAPER